MASGLKFKEGCFGMNKKFRYFALIAALTSALIAFFMTRAAYAEVPWDSNFDSTTENNAAILNGLMGGRESAPQRMSEALCMRFNPQSRRRVRNNDCCVPEET